MNSVISGLQLDDSYCVFSSGSIAASSSARATITWHCFTEASSSILPSIITAPVPSPIAAITRRACATSSTLGEKTRFAIVICAGCRLQAPTQPRRNALRNWSSQATVSLMSPNGP